ncbi:Uu.00g071720.m01.CDS01 [Anthostomella pinea]|uniref:Uu.00g071720.m01.CDS01 n=1 Tax=Anthostomella pinea TaxID=933095 RepID=A0AAI8VUX3_9PEZI|nr:Uu.00g071720.m01.CDS01 [Anthostomella pinea]
MYSLRSIALFVGAFGGLLLGASAAPDQLPREDSGVTTVTAPDGITGSATVDEAKMYKWLKANPIWGDVLPGIDMKSVGVVKIDGGECKGAKLVFPPEAGVDGTLCSEEVGEQAKAAEKRFIPFIGKSKSDEKKAAAAAAEQESCFDKGALKRKAVSCLKKEASLFGVITNAIALITTGPGAIVKFVL